MADQVVSGIALAVDTTQVNEATQDLEGFAAAAGKTEGSVKGVGSAFVKMAGDTNSMAASLKQIVTLQSEANRSFQSFVQATSTVNALAEANARLVAAAKPAAQAMDSAASAGEKLIASLRDQIATYGKSTDEVLRYKAAQSGVAAEAAPLILQLQNITAAFDASQEAARKDAAALREDAAAKKAAANAQQSFLDGLKVQAETLNMSATNISRYRATQLGVAKDAEQFIAAIERSTVSTGKLGVSAGQTAAAMRQLPAQLTDVVTQLAGGQSPFLVLLQQGGQVKDSFGGMGEALKALGSVITPTVIKFTVLAASIGAAILAYRQGSDEFSVFNKALILSGNYAGTTTGQLKELAKAQDKVAGTQGQAAAVLAQLVSTGTVAASMFAKLTAAAVGFEHAGGGAASEVVKKFEALGRSPLQTLLKLNEAEHFLTRAIYEQVLALEARGKLQEAATVAQNAYADATIERTAAIEKGLGSIEKAWRAIIGTAKEAWDAMLDVGRERTPEEKIAELEKKLAANDRRTDRADSIGPNGPRQGADAQRAEIVRQLKDLQNAAELARVKAEETGKAAQKLAEDLANLPELLAKQAAAAQGVFAKLSEQTKGAIAEFDSMAKRGLFSPVEAIEGKGDAALSLLRGQLREQQALYDIAVKRGAKDSELTSIAAQAAVTRIAILNQERATQNEILDFMYARKKTGEEALRAERQSDQAQIDELNNRSAKAYAAIIDQAQEYGRAIDEANEVSAREVSLIGATARERAISLEYLRLEIAERRQLDQIKRADNLSPAERDEAARIVKEGTIRAKAGAEAKIVTDEMAKASQQVNSTLSDAIVDAFKDGENAGKKLRDSLVNMFETMVLRPTIAAAIQPFSNAIAGYLTGGQGGGAGGGASWMNSASSLYGAGKAGYGWLSGSSAAAGATPAFTSSAATAPMAEYAGTTSSAAGGSSVIPIIGWILAAIAASDSAYKGGNTLDMLDRDAMKYGVGTFERDKYHTLSDLGFSERWSQVLSGAPLTARLFGHKASSSGFAVGSVQDGDFVQSSTRPFNFGDNTLGTGIDKGLQDIVSTLAAAVGVAAGQFGGKLTEGLKVTALTDRDRENQVSALIGYLNGDKLIAGSQTGTGAFKEGGPLKGAEKIAADQLDSWIKEQMPLLIIQGLKQSDLDDRFTDFFNSVVPGDLTAEKAAELLATANGVQQLAAAFKPLGGVFDQFGTASVQAVADFAKMTGGVDQLTATTSSFYQNFYSKAEKIDITSKGVGDALTAVGQAMPDLSKGADNAVTAWREMLAAQDLSTEAGRQAAAAILGNSDAFFQLVQNARDGEEEIKKTNTAFSDFLDQFRPMGAAFKYLSGLPRAFVDAVAEASGGLDNLGHNLSGYFDNFFSPSQKASEALASVTNTLAGVGLQVPKTNAEFVAMLTTQAALGPAGAKAVAAMLSVQDSFHTFTEFMIDQARNVLDAAMAKVERSVSAQKDKNTDRYNADIKAIDELEKAARATFKQKQDQIKEERKLADLAKETAESIADNALKLLDAQDKVAKKAYELALQAAEDASKLLDTTYAKNDSAVTKRQIGTDASFAQFALDIANNIALANGGLGDGYDKALADAKDAQHFLETAFSAGELGANMLAEQGKAAANAFDLAGKALDAAIEAATKSVDDIKELQDLLKSTISSLRPVGSEEMDRKRAQLLINTALAEAQSSGKLPNADDIRSALQAVSRPSQDFFGSRSDYLRDFFKTSISLKSLSGITGVKLDAAEQALKVAEKQRDDLQKYHDAEIKQYDLVRAALKDQYDIAKKGAEDIIAAIQAAEKTRGEALEVARDAINTALDDARKAYDETIKSLNTRNDTAQTELDAALEKYGLDRDAIKAAYDKAQKALDDILDESKKAYNAALGIDDSVDNVESAVNNLGTAIKGYGDAIGQSMAAALGPLIEALNNFKLNGGGVYTTPTPTPTPAPTPTPTPSPTPTTVVPIGTGTTPIGPNPDPTVDRTTGTGTTGTNTYNGSKDGEEGAPGGSAATQQQIIDIIMSGLATGSYGAIKTALEPVGLGGYDIEKIAGLTQGTWDALTQNTKIGTNSVASIITAMTQFEATGGPGWDKETVGAAYNYAKSQGLTANTIDAILRQQLGSVNALANKYGFPAFAQGTNIVPRDMVAQIHAGERIIPAADNRALLAALRNPGIANEVLIEEVKALRKELQDLKACGEATARNTNRIAKTTDRWDGDGLPEERPAS